MTDPALERKVSALLAALVLLDLTLSSVALFFPGFWFQVFHGVPYNDPQGFLRRMAANWAAFLLFQAIAFFRWRKEPYWLAVVAGIRFSDIFTDWTYLAFSHDLTWFAKAALPLMLPMNLGLGWYLLRSYLKLRAR